MASALLSGPSFTFILHAVAIAFAVLQQACGNAHGPETDKPKYLNQLLDLDYVTFSLCCRAFESSDKLPSRLESGLRNAAVQRWQAKP
jgi:hypothetical protein